MRYLILKSCRKRNYSAPDVSMNAISIDQNTILEFYFHCGRFQDTARAGREIKFRASLKKGSTPAMPRLRCAARNRQTTSAFSHNFHQYQVREIAQTASNLRALN